MNELTYPFKFRAFELDPIYTAEYFDKNSVKVSWREEGGSFEACIYDELTVKAYLLGGAWKIEELEVTIKQSEYDSLIDEINMLRELVAELTSVMTLEDWQQALEEGWEFETRQGDLINVENIFDPRNAYPVKGSNSINYTLSGCFWDSGKEHESDIIKRVK